jgi:4-hydroxybenzoate polyprenyltransferase
VFAMPFALAAMLVAAGGLPGWRVAGLILWCLVTARTAAMAFNRQVDWDYDRANPRTAGRQRLGSRRLAGALTCAALAGFLAGTWFLNTLCFMLAPLAIVMILSYSLTKRFTAYTHFFLGLALAAAPMGAWAAVRGDLLSWQPWVLAAAVLCWVFGFDLIYSTQDADFDRGAGLHSIPARHGVPAALRLAGGLHGAAWLLLGVFGLACGFGWIYGAGWFLIAGALVFEHRLARTGDVARVNAAFFQANAFVGLVLLAAVAVEIFA